MARNILSGGHLDLSVSKQILIIAQDDVSDPNKFGSAPSDWPI